MSKDAQVWTLDLIVGVTVFLFLIMIYLTFTNNISASSASNFNEIYDDIVVASDTLVSTGSPQNWTAGNVTEVGITDGKQRLSITKLQNLSSIDYSRLKTLLKTRYDYLIFFENRSSGLMNLSNIEYIGKPGLTKENLKDADPYTIVSIRRFLIHESDIITMVIYLWE